jgi:hypothetical protein
VVLNNFVDLFPLLELRPVLDLFHAGKAELVHLCITSAHRADVLEENLNVKVLSKLLVFLDAVRGGRVLSKPDVATQVK